MFIFACPSYFTLKRKTVGQQSSKFCDSVQWTPGDTLFRHEVILGLYDFDTNKPPSPYTCLSLEAYFRYQTNQADQFLHDGGQHVVIRTHRHFVQISRLLKDNLTKTQAQDQLRLLNLHTKNPYQERAIGVSLDFVARILLMIEIGTVPNGFSGHDPLVWGPQETLRQFLALQFAPLQTPSQERVKLGKIFTARNIERIAGIKIRWTNNLADHLRLFDTEENEMVVNIFHHASFLIIQKENYQIPHGTGSLYPQGLIEETIRTLALLFPRSDKELAKWYKIIAAAEHLDLNACLCPHLRSEYRQIDKFEFWRERLILLKQAFDDAEPNSWSQWWHDKRRGVHRYPLLLAAAALLLTVILGLIQVIEGALQVYKAYKPTG